MAVFHVNVKVVKRSKGQSSVAAAAYRSRSEMQDQRTGETWDYSQKHDDVLFEGVYAPKDSPEWMKNREQLWNEVERTEKRKDSQLARDFTVALPHELNVEQQRYAVQDFVRENFVRQGYVADVAIHRPGKEGDQRNTHAHILVTMRKVEGQDFAAKKEQFQGSGPDKAQLQTWRESWTNIGNRHLQRHGHKPTLDNRSYEVQGVDRKPTFHLGQRASQMERKGIETERGDKLHDIKQENTARAIVKELKPHAAENKPERQFREQQAMAIATKIDETSENKRGRGFAVHVRELMDSMREAGQKMADAVSEVGRKLGDAIGLPGQKEKGESNRPPPVSKEHAQERVGSWYPGRNDKTLRDEGKQPDTPKRRETPEEQITRLSKERTKNEPKIDMPNAPKL